MKRQHYCGQFRYRPDRPDHVVSDTEACIRRDAGIAWRTSAETDSEIATSY